MSNVTTNAERPNETFSGALDAIFSRQKSTKITKRCGSTASQKSKLRGDDVESQHSTEKQRKLSALSEKSLSKGSVKKDGDTNSRRFQYNSMTKEHNKVLSQSCSDKHMRNDISDSEKSKRSMRNSSYRASNSTDSEENRYIIDGTQ